MDVRLTNVWIEDLLQHNDAKPCKLNERLNLIQKQRVQHGRIARCNVQIDNGMQRNFSKKIDENE